MLVPLKIPPGVVRGASPIDAPGRWYDMNLVRWHGGVLEPIKGWLKTTLTPFASRVRAIHRWRDNLKLARSLVFTNDKIWAGTGAGTFVDVTPAGGLPDMSTSGGLPVGYGVGPYGAEGYGTARAEGSDLLSPVVPMWSWDNYGEDVFAVTSAGGRLLFFDTTNPTSPLQALGLYDVATISRGGGNLITLTTVQPHWLSTGETVTVAGVADATYNGTFVVTVTGANSFTYTATGGAGSSSGGTVADASLPTNNRSVFVTEERHIMLLQAGGNPRRLAWSSRENFTDWDFASTTNTAGYLDLEARTPLYTQCKVRNGALVFSETEVFYIRFIGSPFVYGAELLEETRIISPRALVHDAGSAFWWSKDGFYTSEGMAVRPIPCPIWTYLLSDLNPERLSLIHCSDHGTYPEVWWFYPSGDSSICNKYVIFNYLENWWSIGSLQREAMSPSLGITPPIMAGSHDHNLYEHDTGYESADGTTRDVFVETNAISVPVAGDRVWEMTQLMLGSNAPTDTFSVEVMTRQTSQGAERLFGPYTVRDDGYCDVRVTGRDARIRINAIEDREWQLGEIRVDVAQGSRR